MLFELSTGNRVTNLECQQMQVLDLLNLAKWLKPCVDLSWTKINDLKNRMKLEGDEKLAAELESHKREGRIWKPKLLHHWAMNS